MYKWCCSTRKGFIYPSLIIHISSNIFAKVPLLWSSYIQLCHPTLKRIVLKLTFHSTLFHNHFPHLLFALNAKLFPRESWQEFYFSREIDVCANSTKFPFSPPRKVNALLPQFHCPYGSGRGYFRQMDGKCHSARRWGGFVFLHRLLLYMQNNGVGD